MDIYKEKKYLKYSQNFLKNYKLVENLIIKSNITSEDIVYEIGPGKGIITEQLAKRCAKVIGIEKDQKLSVQLLDKFINNPKIIIQWCDFLKYNLPKSGRYKIFSNIPFNLTADIITKITSEVNPPEDCYLIVQKEAAKKFVGFPYSKRTQMDSLLLKPWFEMKVLYQFKRTDFKPIPKVDSVLIQIQKHEKPLIEKDQSQLYRDFIVYAFNQWKPNLKTALKKIFTTKQFKRLSKELRFNINATPTNLNLDQWLGLFRYFSTGIEEGKKELVIGSENILKRQQSKLQKMHRTRYTLKT